MNRKKLFLCLIMIVLLGSFLRFYKLGNNSFVADEFLDINASYGYFKTGQWQAWDFNLEKPAERINEASDHRAWLYRIQPAYLFKFKAPTEATARTISALWGIASIILIYSVGAYFSKSKTTGLIAALLFAISIDGLEFSRKMRMYAMFFPVYLAFSWMVFKFLEEKYAGKNKWLEKIWTISGLNISYLLPALLLGISSVHLHQLTINIVVVIAIYMLIQSFLIAVQEKRNYLNRYSLMLFVGIIILSLAYAVVPSKMSHLMAGLKFFNNHYIYLIKVFSDYSHWIIAFLFTAGGFYCLYKKGLRKESLWLALSVVAPIVAAVFFWKRNPGSQYIYFIKSFVIILAAAGIYGLLEYLKENLNGFGKKSYTTLLILIFLIFPFNQYFLEKNNTYRQTSQSENPNYRKVFNYVKKNRVEGDVIITRNFRNYYLSGAKIPVFSYGGELATEKLSLEEVQKITLENKNGWAVIAENDERYISKEAQNYLEKNAQIINNIETRGKITVYRWRERN